MHNIIGAKVKMVAKALKWGDVEPTPIVYWNLRNTGGHPKGKDTEGAVMLAGFSPSLLAMVMNGKALDDVEIEVVQTDGTVKTEKVRVTPAQIFRKALDDSMYDPVRVVLAGSEEGCLKEYQPPMPMEEEDGFEVL